MVLPWVDCPLSGLLKCFEAKSEVAYVEFEALYRPDEMPGTRSLTSTIDWPCRESVRMDEALFRPNHIPTQMFNGYCEQVALLYKAMNLARNY